MCVYFSFLTLIVFTDDCHSPHLAGRCPWPPPPALFSDLGRRSWEQRLQCYWLQAEWERPQCWPLKREQGELQPWLLAGRRGCWRAGRVVQAPAWRAWWGWLGRDAGRVRPAALLPERAVLLLWPWQEGPPPCEPLLWASRWENAKVSDYERVLEILMTGC